MSNKYLILTLWTTALAVALGGVAPRVAGLLLSTVSVALPAAIVSTALGCLLGVLLAKTDLPWRLVAMVVLVGLLLLPLHLIAAGWLAAMGSLGWFTTFTANPGQAALLEGWRGAVWVHAMAATPVATLLVAASLRLIDSRREEQALLEAGSAWVIARVSLPQAAPGVVAAFCWSVIFAGTEIAATDLFRVRTFAEEVYTQAALGAFDSVGHATQGVAGLVFATSLLATFLYCGFELLGAQVAVGLESGLSPPWRARLGGRRVLAIGLLVGVLLLVAAVPLGSLVYQAGTLATQTDAGWTRHWSPSKFAMALLQAPWQHRREIAISSLLAVGVATVATALGALGAWTMRYGRWRATFGWGVVCLLLATPGPVIGLFTIRVFNQSPDSSLAWLGELYGTWALPLVVQTVRLAPIAALLLWPVFVNFPVSLLEAAHSEGASWLTRLWRIAIPLVWPAVVVVWVIVFALSLGELSATALVVPPGTPPLSVRLLSLLHYGVEDRVAAICLDLFVLQTVLAGAAIGLFRRNSLLNKNAA